jgi:hypothetical protein
MAAKICKFCHNLFSEDALEQHTTHCALNPDVQEKTRKMGEIERFIKTAVLKDGKIERMYWAHSTGAKDFDIEPILIAWRKIDPDVDPHGVQFLESRGFTVLMT